MTSKLGEWRYVESIYKDGWYVDNGREIGPVFIVVNQLSAEQLCDYLNALEARLEQAEQRRDSIQHQEIVAAQTEFNPMRQRAIDAEAERDRLRAVLEDLCDVQNGPPLERKSDADAWQAAYDAAHAILWPVA